MNLPTVKETNTIGVLEIFLDSEYLGGAAQKAIKFVQLLPEEIPNPDVGISTAKTNQISLFWRTRTNFIVILFDETDICRYNWEHREGWTFTCKDKIPEEILDLIQNGYKFSKI